MIEATTPMTVTLPAGDWEFLMHAARKVLASHEVSDPIIGRLNMALQEAVAKMEKPDGN